jgi:hypothetical protein
MLFRSISMPGTGTGRTILYVYHLINVKGIYGAVPNTDMSAPRNTNARAAKIPTYGFHMADVKMNKRRPILVSGFAYSSTSVSG